MPLNQNTYSALIQDKKNASFLQDYGHMQVQLSGVGDLLKTVQMTIHYKQISSI